MANDFVAYNPIQEGAIYEGFKIIDGELVAIVSMPPTIGPDTTVSLQLGDASGSEFDSDPGNVLCVDLDSAIVFTNEVGQFDDEC